MRVEKFCSCSGASKWIYAYEKASKFTQKAMSILEESYPDIDFDEIPSKAENADTISDAITCYMQFGEYTPEQIWEEIKSVN